MSKIINRWHERYYTSSTPLPHELDDYSFSNMIYDGNKGVSHVLLPYFVDSSSSRFVSDVELCMSSDPNITSRFSSEHRDMIRKQLVSQPRTPAVNGPFPTDDQLMQNGAIQSLERDEIVAASKANMSRLDAELPYMSAPSVSPTPSPSSVESPKTE